jgi:nucleotide-binding universal stress UspA family protein
MKVLIGYDGSECADAAILDLRQAGLPAETEAMVLSVVDVFPHLPPEFYAPPGTFKGASGPGRDDSPIFAKCRQLAAGVLGETRAMAADAAERVRARFPMWEVSAEACTGPPHATIVQRAEQWKADLVVVGSHGRSVPSRMVLGSVSQQVLQHAHCSVRIARCPDNIDRLSDEPPRIVLGIDGSPDAAAAISAVSMRNWPEGTRVQVVMAMDPRVSNALIGVAPPLVAWAAGPPGAPPRETPSYAHEATENAAEELRDAGLLAAPVVLHGDPKRILLDVAARWDADCIFVGAKGHSRLERFLLGSVSASVAARAGCSVEVVRQA